MNNLLQGAQTTTGRTDLKKRDKSSEVFAGQKSAMSVSNRPPFLNAMNQSCLRIGLPSGSLQESTLDLFAKAGYQITGSKRSYKPAIDDPELEVRLLRAQEISRYVEHGFLDCGITGKDWIEENNSDVELIEKLQYRKSTSSPTRWALVVPSGPSIQSVKDLEGKRIATEAVGLTTRYLNSRGVRAKVEFSWGSTEVKVPELVDAIVDITET